MKYNSVICIQGTVSIQMYGSIRIMKGSARSQNSIESYATLGINTPIALKKVFCCYHKTSYSFKKEIFYLLIVKHGCYILIVKIMESYARRKVYP